MLVVVFVAGLGIAAYHPEGAKFASYASGSAARERHVALQRRREHRLRTRADHHHPDRGVARAQTGGRSSPSRALVGAAIILVLPYLRGLRPTAPASRAAAGEDRPRAMAVLIGVILLRTTTWFGLITFVPLWVVSLGHSEADGNRLLSLMLVAGVAGAAVFGPVADRIGLRRTLLATTAVLPPLVLVFVSSAVSPARSPCARRRLRGRDVRRVMVLSQLYLPRHVGAGLRAQRRARGRSRRRRGGRARRGGRRGRSRDGADDLRGDAVLAASLLPAPAAAGARRGSRRQPRRRDVRSPRLD